MAEQLQVAPEKASGKPTAPPRPLDRPPSSSLADFEYDLPPHLIAQAPLADRTAARLLVVRRDTGKLDHLHVRDLPGILSPGDLLVCNNTKVLPARLYGVRERTGGKWEGLFLREQADGSWEMLTQTRGTLQPGETIHVAAPHQGEFLRLRFEGRTEQGRSLLRPEAAGSPETLLSQFGHVPLPPYIRGGRDVPADRDHYQTVFAERPGAVAAPTAGLHFTPALLDQIAAAGIDRAYVTLHVGPGTFEPIKSADVAEHHMHAEWGELDEPCARAIARCRERRGRVVAVGTTSVRVLETAAQHGPLRPWRGETQLYIHPPFRFRAVDVLLTNFHLPRSTLLVLVSAFAGRELILKAYAEAIAAGYRFYSYGDAMLIL